MDVTTFFKPQYAIDLVTSLSAVQEMQRELESVEAQYALDRRRKSSDDVISTPSSYRSRSSSIPSSEDVDEPKLLQVREECIGTDRSRRNFEESQSEILLISQFQFASSRNTLCWLSSPVEDQWQDNDSCFS